MVHNVPEGFVASGAVWPLAASQKVVTISIDELGAWAQDRVSQRGQWYPKPDLEGLGMSKPMDWRGGAWSHPLVLLVEMALSCAVLCMSESARRQSKLMESTLQKLSTD